MQCWWNTLRDWYPKSQWWQLQASFCCFNYTIYPFPGTATEIKSLCRLHFHSIFGLLRVSIKTDCSGVLFWGALCRKSIEITNIFYYIKKNLISCNVLCYQFTVLCLQDEFADLPHSWPGLNQNLQSKCV